MEEAAVRAVFDDAVQNSEPAFERFFLARFLGLQISYTETSCIVEFDVKDYMYNPQGSLHGGVIATALDVSMGHWIKRTTGQGGATLELKIQYMRRVTEGRMRCEGSYVRQGRNISFLEARMWDGEGKPAALATATFQVHPAASPPRQESAAAKS